MMAPPEALDLAKIAEEKEFEERLKLAKEKGDLLKKEIQAASPVSLLAEIDYDKPQPSVSETLSKAAANMNGTPVPAAAGPAQAFAGVIAIVLLTVIVATNSGSDLQMQTQSYLPGQGGASSEISSEEKLRWEGERQRFEARIAENANDVEALEGLAVSLSELRQYDQAEDALQKLVALPAAPVDAFRLLGEVRSLKGNLKGAAAAYKQGVEASAGDPSLEMLQGLAATLVTDGRAAEAAEVLDGVKAAGVKEDAAVGRFELELLRGKVFSQWRGHTADAEAVYDALIKTSPDDFRGYLAKAVLLKEEGRKSDAERLFIQAKFYSPTKEAKALVDRISGRT